MIAQTSTPRDQPITIRDLKRVARRTFSTGQWLERFGTPRYNIVTHKTVLEKCAGETAAQKILVTPGKRLPERWTAIKFGMRYYIFYASDAPMARKSGELTAQEFKIVKDAVDRGLRLGDQKILADKFECSESLISRTVAKIRRDPKQAHHHIKKRGKEPHRRLAIETNLVEAVFYHLLTVKEWLTYVGPRAGHFYGIHDSAYVYQMCAGRPNGPTGNRTYKAKLPDGWKSVRMGESWLLYHKTLEPRSHWIRTAQIETLPNLRRSK